ncbi:MAG: Hsp20/alpha crystallin family protein [Planctomycetes bacterium]|nr:Hsp20/alpha crystallin family protein [Planctomycetota bacterium]
MVCSYEKNRLRGTLAGSLDLVPSQMSHLFEQLLGGSSQQPESQPGSWNAPATLYEQSDHYAIEIDMPGVKQDDLQVTYEKGVLSITAQRKAAEADDRKVWQEERGYGQVSRQVKLPDLADPDSINARLRDGVLSVTVAKKPEAQPKKIEIKSV